MENTTTSLRTIGAEALYPVGLGCMGMSEFYGASNDAESIRVIHRALALGRAHLDTADMYGVGKNERLVGQAIKDRRQSAFVATKFAFERGADGSFEGVRGDPAYVRQACEASLLRLGLSTIDLYYQHRVDPDVPIEDTVGELGRLVDEGKVRYIGLSEASDRTIRRAHAVHPIAALQSELSLWSRDLEGNTLQTCGELGIAFVAYSPLGRGFLTGAINNAEDLSEGDFRRGSERFIGDAAAHNRALVARLEAFAAERDASAAQVALGWVLSRGAHVHTIPGTRSLRRLEENGAAAGLQLNDEELAALDAIAPLGAFQGPRYPASRRSLLNG